MGCSEGLICPICQRPLRREERSLRCAGGHTFDLAREGYVNLLPATRKQGDMVGDSREMLQARRRFLQRGFYAPLLDAVRSEALAGLAHAAGQAKAAVVVDAGCGEGSYLAHVAAGCAAQPAAQRATEVRFFGLDVAKAAVRMAAKRHSFACFFVADLTRFIPLPDASVHVLLNVFAPRSSAGFARLVRPDGRLLVVIPQAGHLQSLRRTFGLLGIEEDKRRGVAAQLAGNFELTAVHTVTCDLQLDNAALQDLVQMTPAARHLSTEKRRQISDTPHFETTAQFELLVWRRRANQSERLFGNAGS